MQPSSAYPGFKGRRLLPAPPKFTLIANPGGHALPPISSLIPRGPLSLPPRGPLFTMTCEPCWRRKTTCDGILPMCSFCISHGGICVYLTSNAGERGSQPLKRKYAERGEFRSDFEEIFVIIQTRPEKEARGIFSRVRGGGDAPLIIRQIREGNVLFQVALVPETRYRYEFPFIKDMPEFLQQMDNRYLNSLLYEWTRKGALAQQAAADGIMLRNPAYLRPYHAAELTDNRIAKVKPSDWTAVSTNDGLMRKLLAAYFMHGSQFFICFQKDYFLQDMVANRHRFCSSLLVNAVLAVGYSCYRGTTNRYEHWNPQNLGAQFLAEAKRLWELEVGKCRLTKIHAGMVITLAHNMSCMDKAGWAYTLQAITMARDIQLFDSAVAVRSRERRRAREFTAWALFNYQCLHCYVMSDVPIIKNPPKIALPDPSVDPEWYGETWIKYPLSASPVPIYFGHLFKACADLRVIMNDICLYCFERPASSRKIMLGQVLEFHSRLKDWQNNLPGPLTPERIVFPSHFILHMNYQMVLINLHEPFRVGDSYQHGHPTGVLAAEANAHLETLVRLYFLRHGFESFDPFLVYPLNVLGSSAVNKINANPSPSDVNALRSAAILAAKGMHHQGQSNYIGYVTLRSLKDSMGPNEIRLLGQIIALKDVEDEVAPKRQMREIQG